MCGISWYIPNQLTRRSSGPTSRTSSSAMRAPSISLPYCTPEGHAVSHARHSRQSVMCSAKASRKVSRSMRPCDYGAHQRDAPAWPVGFGAEDGIGRTDFQTLATTHALIQQFPIFRGGHFSDV